MPYEIIRADITNLGMHVDAIVNTAHPDPRHGLGTDAAIFKKAGPKLKAHRKFIGKIQEGHADVTPAFELDSKIIIHTVAPVWRDGKYGEETILRHCYDQALLLAERNSCQSIAFPLIGSGNLGFPRPVALKIAIDAFMDFCFHHEIKIYLVLFDRESFECGKKLHTNIPAFIDDRYANEMGAEEYRREDGLLMPVDQTHHAIRSSRTQRTATKDSIDDVFRENPTASFSDTMKMLMESLGKQPPDVYKSGEITAQTFLKTYNNHHAKPKKPMALAIAIALTLDLEQTKQLIHRAGHSLDPNNSWDSIIIHAIEMRTYNVSDINHILMGKGHTTFLGSTPKKGI
jgi:O-acetyl-ADP-ribose deacetylase (regulator of RNase III)